MLWKSCIHYANKFGKLSRSHRTGKDQFSFQSQRKAMPKNVKKKKKKKGKNYCTIALISHASKVMPKILQPRLQQHVHHEILVVQARFRKGRGTEIKLPPSSGSLKKQESFWKISTSFGDYTKAFDCVYHNKLWKIFKRWEYQTAWPASWEICMQVKKQQLELDI